MNAPLRWTKQFASQLGGLRNGMIMAWPGHVAKPGSVCAQFAHLVDIVPTVLEAAKLPAPNSVYGVRQKSLDGQSLLPSLNACSPNKPRTQYFEIGGKIGLYHDGWFLSGDDGRTPWENLPPTGARPTMEWTLYDLSKDFSQSTDLSAREPARLAAMMALWKQEAERNEVLPLDHRFASARVDRSAFGSMRKHFDYWGKDISLPATGTAPFLAGRSFTLTADLVLDKPDASGAIVAWGSRFGGWSLYLDHGRPAFQWARSTDPNEMAQARSSNPLPQGRSKLTLRFATLGPGNGADVSLASGTDELARAHLPNAMLMPAGNGESFDIGRDLGVPVTEYRTSGGRIDGDVPHVAIDFDH
jgi:arylsulfatase